VTDLSSRSTRSRSILRESSSSDTTEGLVDGWCSIGSSRNAFTLFRTSGRPSTARGSTPVRLRRTRLPPTTPVRRPYRLLHKIRWRPQFQFSSLVEKKILKIKTTVRLRITKKYYFHLGFWLSSYYCVIFAIQLFRVPYKQTSVNK